MASDSSTRRRSALAAFALVVGALHTLSEVPSARQRVQAVPLVRTLYVSAVDRKNTGGRRVVRAPSR